MHRSFFFVFFPSLLGARFDTRAIVENSAELSEACSCFVGHDEHDGDGATENFDVLRVSRLHNRGCNFEQLYPGQFTGHLPQLASL